ncbi:MAG: ribonuclease HI family protein [Planctomycetota bacterium]|nr:ribonuclease HI family protein [Planctomycetota bacterium]
MGNKAFSVLINIDGGARGNPGPAGAGVVIQSADDGTVLFEGGFFLGEATNNVAEYQALLEALPAARKLGAESVEVCSDSELLVRQMNGRYRVKNAGLKPMFDRACRMRKKFSNFSIRHVRREENTLADKLVNQAINLKQNVEDAAGHS